MLQDENVGPGLMVAVDQIPTFGRKPVYAFYLPAGALRQRHPATIAGYPCLGNEQQDRVSQAPCGQGNDQLDQREEHQKWHQYKGIERQ